MKKKLLKTLSAVLALVLALGILSGCGSSPASSSSMASSGSGTSAASDDGTDASTSAEAGSDELYAVEGVDLNNLGPVLQKIYDSGTLVVGNDSSYPPFGFIDTSTNEAIGVEREMAQAIADRLSEVLGKEITLDFQSMDFSAVLSSLSTGMIDLICSCCTVTEERKEVMDFSDPYLQTQDVMLILVENADQYQSLADFEGKALAANTGSSQEVRANSISDNVTSTATVSDAILQLTSGRVDAIVVDNITAERYSVNSDQLYSFELSDDEVEQVDKAVAMQKGNEDLQAIVNTVVADVTENGQADAWVTEYAQMAADMGLND